MALVHYLGLLLVIGQTIFARANSIVLDSTVSPVVRWALTLREGVLLPIALLAFTFLGDHQYSLSILAGAAVLSSLSAVMLLGFSSLTAVPHVASEGATAKPKGKALDDSGSLDQEAHSDDSDPYADPPTGVRRVQSKIREQRNVTQALWDAPAAMLFVSLSGTVESSVGGALRLADFPAELAGPQLVGGSLSENVIRGVMRNPHRQSFELHSGARTYTAVAAPWVSLSGRLLGATVVVLTSDSDPVASACEASPFRVVHG